MFGSLVERLTREAMGAGKPIDLDAYLESPPGARVAYSMLRSAGLLPREVELLREGLGEPTCEQEEQTTRGQIQRLQLERRVLVERNRAERRGDQGRYMAGGNPKKAGQGFDRYASGCYTHFAINLTLTAFGSFARPV